MKEIKPKLAHNFWVESSWKKETEQKWMIMKSSFFFLWGGTTTWPQSREDKVFFFKCYFCGNTENRGQENGAKLIFSLSLYYSDFVLIRDFRSRLSNEFLDELERTTNGIAGLLYCFLCSTFYAFYAQLLILGIIIKSLLHMQLFIFFHFLHFFPPLIVVGFISVRS